jgi:hypothetical protein
MFSAYDDTVVTDLRRSRDEARCYAEAAAEEAENSSRCAAEHRARARQYDALLAHAEGREADHEEIVRQVSGAAAQLAGLNLALELLGFGLPEVFSWNVSGRGGGCELRIHLARNEDHGLANIATWAARLGGEVTHTPHDGQIHHEVRTVYREVPVEVVTLTRDVAGDTQQREGDQS